MGDLRTVDVRDEICAEPIARYYELGGEVTEAIAVRDRELAAITKKGMLHRACCVQIERCRLLERVGNLTPADINYARQMADQQRVPGWYLERLGRFGAT
jgi:hypothetical protein